MTGYPAEEPNIADLRLLLGELLDRWDQGPEEARLRREDRPSPGQVMVVLGLAAHTHRLGHAVRTLVDQGLQFESAATVRAAFECGITAQWMVQYGNDSFFAFIRQAQRQRKALAKTMREMTQFTNLSSSEEIARLLDEDVEVPETAGDQSARYFETLCKNFEVSPFYYYGYRSLSGFAHAGSMVASAYIESDDPVSMRLDPGAMGGGRIWLATTCCALIWAGRAADMLSADEPRRAFLLNAADALGILAELPLTEKARKARDAHHAARG